jgi:hypothetical protein
VHKLNTFCLYLAKLDVASFDDLLTASALSLLESGVAKATPSSSFADTATLYTFPGFSQTPKWVPLLSGIVFCAGSTILAIAMRSSRI